jgi:hypothetical protein
VKTVFVRLKSTNNRREALKAKQATAQLTAEDHMELQKLQALHERFKQAQSPSHTDHDIVARFL